MCECLRERRNPTHPPPNKQTSLPPPPQAPLQYDAPDVFVAPEGDGLVGACEAVVQAVARAVAHGGGNQRQNISSQRLQPQAIRSKQHSKFTTMQKNEIKINEMR